MLSFSSPNSASNKNNRNGGSSSSSASSTIGGGGGHSSTSMHPIALPMQTSLSSLSNSSSSSSLGLPTSSLPLDLKIKPSSAFMTAVPLFSCPSVPMISSSFSNPLSTHSSRPLSYNSSLPLEPNKLLLGKKIHISNLQEKPVLPPDFEQTLWAKLFAAFIAIFNNQKPNVPLEELYRACASLCRNQFGPFLHEKLTSSLTQHCENLLPTLEPLVTYATRSPERLLQPLLQCWEAYTLSLKTLCQVCLYLDRVYSLPNKKLGIWDLGLHVFRTHVLKLTTSTSASNTSLSSFNNSSMASSSLTTASAESASNTSNKNMHIGDAVVCAWVHWINQTREEAFPNTVPATELASKYPITPSYTFLPAQTTSFALIQACATFLNTLDMYPTFGYPALVTATNTFYAGLVRTWLDTPSRSSTPTATTPLPPASAASSTQVTPDIYLRLCHGVVAFETYLVTWLPAPPERMTELSTHVLHTMVREHHVYLLSGLPGWLCATPPHLDALATLYVLCARVSVLPDLRARYMQWLVEEGQRMCHPADAVGTMTRVLQLKQAMDQVVHTFQDHELFVTATKEAFFKFLNVPHHRPAECLAKFIDTVLKSRKKTGNDQTLPSLLDQIMVLFKHLQGKDVFANVYKSLLGKRLLDGKTTSMDAEEAMLARLRTECGKEFTDHLEKMLNDVSLSTDLTQTFLSSKYAEKLTLDFSITVCQDAVWTLLPGIASPPFPFCLPVEVTHAKDMFTQFYQNHYNGGRVLTWHPELSTLVLKAHVWNAKELCLPFSMSLVLLAFNSSVKYTLADLQRATGISDTVDLQRALTTLVAGKVALLHSSTSTAWSSTTQLSLVDVLHTSKWRLSLTHLATKEVELEDDIKVQEKVAEDRVAVIDAAIVRLLKASKTMAHAALFAAVSQRCSFPVESAMFKARIENLLDREYIERDPNKVNMYKYIA